MMCPENKGTLQEFYVTFMIIRPAIAKIPEKIRVNLILSVFRFILIMLNRMPDPLRITRNTSRAYIEAETHFPVAPLSVGRLSDMPAEVGFEKARIKNIAPRIIHEIMEIPLIIFIIVSGPILLFFMKYPPNNL